MVLVILIHGVLLKRAPLSAEYNRLASLMEIKCRQKFNKDGYSSSLSDFVISVLFQFGLVMFNITSFQ